MPTSAGLTPTTKKAAKKSAKKTARKGEGQPLATSNV